MSDVPPIPPGLFGNNGQYDPHFHPLRNIQARPLEWVQKPYLQADAFHLLAGRKNAGKGTFLALLAAHVTRGSFDGEDRHFGRRVIWIAGGEDSYAIDVRPRIEVAGGDVDLVSVPTPDTDIVLPLHLDAIRRLMGAPGEVGLLVIDPLGGAMESGLSTNSDGDVRPMLRALNRLADEQRAMVFGSRNVTIKSAKEKGALGSILGSTAWVDLPRAVLGLFHDRINSDLRHLHLLTGNRATAGQPGILFQVGGVVPPWGGDEIARMEVVGVSSEDPDELLAVKANQSVSRSADAEKVILDILAERGQLESSVLDAIVAEQTGLAARTVQKIRSERLGRNGRGLIRAIPERLPGGEQVSRWHVMLTEAGRLEQARYPAAPPEGKTHSGVSGVSGFQTQIPNMPFTPPHITRNPTYPLSLSPEDGDSE